jgi:hypothetical protein
VSSRAVNNLSGEPTFLLSEPKLGVNFFSKPNFVETHKVTPVHAELFQM